MDMIAQQKFLKWTILILVILNLSTLAALWLIKPGTDYTAEKTAQNGQGIDVMPFLKEELKLSDEQADKVFRTRNEHQRKVQPILRKMHETKKQLMGSVFENREVNSDSLAAEIANLQKQVELLTHNHLIQLKKILGPEQTENLKKLFGELYIKAQQMPPRAPGMGGQLPPR